MATVKGNGMRTRSSVVFDGPERAFARAYMKGIGFGDEDLRRPTVGIANTWIEAMPCNFHLRGLAEHVKEGVRAAGGTPLEFNSIANMHVAGRQVDPGQAGRDLIRLREWRARRVAAAA